MTIFPSQTHGPAKIVLAYAALAAVWILASDRIAALFADTPQQIIIISTIKGWAFVALTSAILFGLITRMVTRIEAMHTAIAKEQSEKFQALNLLQVISDTSTDAIFVKDTDGRYLLFNPQAGRLIGKQSSEVLGLDDRALFPPEDAEEIMALDRLLLKQEKVETIEEEVHTTQGATTFLTTKGPIYDDRGILIGLFGIARDISERKLAGAALRRNEELLRETQAVANLGYYVFAFQIDHWESSEILDQLFGIDADYPRDTAGWLNLVAPEMRAEMADYLASLHISGSRFDREYPIRRADNGELRWMAGLGRIERDSAGRPVRMIGTIQDITSHKRAEQEMVAAKAQAELASEAKTRFFSAASHDLRQPFQAMRLFYGVLDHKITDAPQREALGYLDRSISSAETLLNELLDVSKLDGGGISISRQQVAPAAIIQDLVAELSLVAADRGLRLRCFTCDDLQITTDPILLKRILSNLVENAIRYTKTGGILVGMRRRGGHLTIEVWDTGIGIAPEVSDLVFEEFFQVNNDARDRARGTGLGLVIVRRLCGLMGYTVSMTSRLGRGSVFRVALPDKWI